MGNATSRTRRFSAAVLLSLVVLSLPLMGCEDDEPMPPDEVVMAFITDLQRGERSEALEALWPESREEIDKTYEDLARNLGEEPPVDREDFLVITRMENTMMIGDVDVVDLPEKPWETGDAATVAVTYRDEEQTEVPLRWHDEKGRWLVELDLIGSQPLPTGADSGSDQGGDAAIDGGENNNDDAGEAVLDEAIDNE